MAKSKNSRRLKSIDEIMLWGLSGGICAKCKAPLIDIESKTHIAHRAHVIARDDKSLPSYRDVPYEEKDIYENILLMCGKCHEETKYWNESDLRELKVDHETHVADTLRGVFRPFEVGKGKYSIYPFIEYEKYYKPFQKTQAIANAIVLIVVIILINTLFGYLYWIQQTRTNEILVGWAFCSVFLITGFIFWIDKFKKAEPSVHYKGKCTFVGCDGTVFVEKTGEQLKDKYPYLGYCNKDNSHTHTVSNDFKRGNYEKIPIITVTTNK